MSSECFPIFLLGSEVSHRIDKSLKGKVIAIHAASTSRAKFPGEWEYLIEFSHPAANTQGWFPESKLDGRPAASIPVRPEEPKATWYVNTGGTLPYGVKLEEKQ